MMSTAIEMIADDDNVCGEGPTWDHRVDRLVWTDIPSRNLYCFEPATNRKALICDRCSVAGIALHASGGLVVAGSEGLHLLAPGGSIRTILTEQAGEILNFNDILADPVGRIYAGTYYWHDGAMTQHGKLYLLDVDGTVRVVADGVSLSNGLALSLDNRTLFYADSAVRRIDAYDVNPQTGALSNKRLFVRVPNHEGLPDGLTVDADGFVWCAQWFGGQVVRYDPDGKVQRRIGLPVKQVSSVALGGKDLTDLYITTASGYAPTPLEPPGFDTKAPMGGSLYRVRLDIAGRRENIARIGPASQRK